MNVGQRVKIIGKAAVGSMLVVNENTTKQVHTHIYALSEAGRGWEKVLSYYANAETLTGVVVEIVSDKNKSYALVQLDSNCTDVATGDWSVKPYKRKDGTVAPNSSIYGKQEKTIGEGNVYGLHLKAPVAFSIARNTFEVIA